MRSYNSFAAAIAAAVATFLFSAGMQPIEASSIVLDDFTLLGGGTASGSGTAATVLKSDLQSGSFGGFEDRESTASYAQNTPRGTRTVEASSGSGLGTLRLINSGSGSGTTSAGFAYAYFGYLSGTLNVNLMGSGNTGFRIETGATSTNSPAGAFTGYVRVSTYGTNGPQSAEFLLPGMWAANAVTEILFSQLTADNPQLDLTDTTEVYVGFKNTAPLAGSTAYNGTATFTKISVVPEPQSLAILGSGWAAIAAGLIRRRRIAAKA